MTAGGGGVTVHVPGLLGPWPAALAQDVCRGLEPAGLAALLSRARRPRGGGGEGEVQPPERLAFHAFGHAPGEGDVPAAAVTWDEDAALRERPREGAAGRAPPASRPRLRADPVHLRPGPEAVRLFDASRLGLSGEEAAALAEALDRHFAPDGLRIEAPHPARWYAWTDAPPDAVFHPPGGVGGRRAAGEALPAGNEGGLWRRRLNEAQMVLHGHRVNEAREARGELPVNSVWFWGAGEAGAPAPLFDEVRTRDPLVRALGARGGARVRTLDEAGAEGGAGFEASLRYLVAPGPELHRAVVERDVESWRRALARLEERWFAPLDEALAAGRVRRVVIDAGMRPGEAPFAAARGPAVRRWLPRSRPRPFAGYLFAADP